MIAVLPNPKPRGLLFIPLQLGLSAIMRKRRMTNKKAKSDKQERMMKITGATASAQRGGIGLKLGLGFRSYMI